MVLCRGSGSVVDCGVCVGEWQRRGLLSWVSLLWMTPDLCGDVDGPEMYELLSGSSSVCI